MRRRCLLTVVPSLTLLPTLAGASPQRDTLRVALLLAAPHASAEREASLVRGVELGVEEASRTAQLFGLNVHVSIEHPTETSLGSSVERLLAKGIGAVIVGGSIDACHEITRIAGNRAVILFTARCNGDRPPVERCLRSDFHLAPSAMSERRVDSLVTNGGAAVAGDRRLALWHHSLHRFGAEQLNERFRRRFGDEMDSRAWAGWMGMKILVESALRARSTRAADLTRHLARPTARFDGHKGEALRFDPRTGELRQRLYVVLGGAAGRVDERVEAELAVDTVFSAPVASSGHASACGTDGSKR